MVLFSIRPNSFDCGRQGYMKKSLIFLSIILLSKVKQSHEFSHISLIYIRELCVSFEIGLDSLNLSLTRVFFVSDMFNFFPMPLFPLSLYYISVSTAPLNICSGVKAGIPFRISPLKCTCHFHSRWYWRDITGRRRLLLQILVVAQLVSNMDVKIISSSHDPLVN